MGTANDSARMGLAEETASLESAQRSLSEEQGLLQRCLLVFLGVSDALLAQARRTPAVGPVVANVEEALSPYATSAGVHLKQHGQPLLAFGDKQLHSLYTLVNSAFPVISPVLETAASASDSALSILSEAAASAKSRGFLLTGVTLYDQYKSAAAEKGEAAAQYLERFRVVAPAVPLVRYVGATVTGVIEWAVDTGRPKESSHAYDVPAETSESENTAVEEVTLAEKSKVATETPETTDKDVAIAEKDVAIADGEKPAAKDSGLTESDAGGKEIDDVVPHVESLFESWTMGTLSRRSSAAGSGTLSRRSSAVGPSVK